MARLSGQRVPVSPRARLTGVLPVTITDPLAMPVA